MALRASDGRLLQMKEIESKDIYNPTRERLNSATNNHVRDASQIVLMIENAAVADWLDACVA